MFDYYELEISFEFLSKSKLDIFVTYPEFSL
jgi:hypothetical protein